MFFFALSSYIAEDVIGLPFGFFGSIVFSSHKTTKSELVPNRGWVRICLLFAILYNVAGHPEADTSALSTFNDKNQVAAYAVNGFAWAVSNKVVGGTSNTTLYES